MGHGLWGTEMRETILAVAVALLGSSAQAQMNTPLTPFPAQVAFVTELPGAQARVVEIDCPTCPGATSFAMQLAGADAPNPVEGQRVRIFCRMEEGVMRIMTVDWAPSGA